MWVPLPTPAEPKLIYPAFCRTSARNSFIDLMPCSAPAGSGIGIRGFRPANGTGCGSFDFLDDGVAAHGVAHLQIRVKRSALAGEHAPRQRHRRQEIAALGMPVRADLRMAHHPREQDLVPADRQGIAQLRHGIIAVERGRKPVHGGDGNVIDVRFLLTDPLLEFFQVLVHRLYSECAGGSGRKGDRG